MNTKPQDPTILDRLDELTTLADAIGVEGLDLHLGADAIAEIRESVSWSLAGSVPPPAAEPSLLGVYRGMNLHRVMPEKLPPGSLVYFRASETRDTFNKGVIRDRPAPGLIRFQQVLSAVNFRWSDSTAWKESELEIVPLKVEPKKETTP